MSGYRPGRLLARLHSEFRDFERHDTASGAARFSVAALAFAVREIVERHFLMHTVIAQFEYSVPAPNLVRSHIRVRHRGALTRRGIEFEVQAGDAVPGLEADEELAAALMPLDFTRCELFGEPSGWRIELQHYGASEVVGRIPALSRYVPLIASQRESLLAAFRGFERVLAGPGKFPAS